MPTSDDPLFFDLLATSMFGQPRFRSPVEAQRLVPGPAQPDPALSKRGLQIDDVHLEYALRRTRRRSIGFLINDNGLQVTAPKWAGVKEIESAIREKKRWIFTKLGDRRERSANQQNLQMQWTDGAALPYLGSVLTLRIRTAPACGMAHTLSTGELTASLAPGATEDQLKQQVQHWLQMEAKRVFSERLPMYAQNLGVAYLSFSLSSAKTRWGSCTSQGKIRLNWRLVHFALPLIDYVVAHELSHLLEMNHSPRFWATVASVFPDFEAARRDLIRQARELPPIF